MRKDNFAVSLLVRLFTPAAVVVAIAVAFAAPAERAMAQAPEASSGAANPYSNLEPSDDYKPDGYYEPYDFSFVKTQGQGGQQTPAAPVAPVPDTPPPDYGVPAAPPSYEPSAVINVPPPPDFSGTANSYPAGQAPVQAAGYGQNEPATNQGGQQTPPAQPVNAPVTPQPLPDVKPPVNNAPAGEQASFKFLASGPKMKRFKLSDADLTRSLDKVISGANVVDKDWLQIMDGVRKYHNGAAANSLTVPPIEDEFERINSVLLTYIYGGTFGKYDAAIMMYRNQYFAFLGPMTRELGALSLKNYNSEERYKLLRLLGGDIIKIISDRLFMFSVKPLSFCVSEIMREVSNGEFYKVEVLFRVMTSAETPIQNLVRPFFHLLKSKLKNAFENEKNAEVRNNFAKAFEMLSKIK